MANHLQGVPSKIALLVSRYEIWIRLLIHRVDCGFQLDDPVEQRY